MVVILMSETCDECGQLVSSELARETHRENTGHTIIDLTIHE